jgi:hypothetical protein
LDLTVFSVVTRNHVNTKRIVTKAKIESKIVRSLRAWHISAYIEIIWNGWKAAGLQVLGPLADHVLPQINPDKIVQLVRRNFSDVAMLRTDREGDEQTKMTPISLLDRGEK